MYDYVKSVKHMYNLALQVFQVFKKILTYMYGCDEGKWPC